MNNNFEENKASTLYFQLQNMIINNDYSRFAETFSEYLDIRINQHIPNVDSRLKNDYKSNVLFFLKTIIQKGYVNRNNKARILNIIIVAAASINEEKNSTLYGNGNEYSLAINFRSQEAINYMRHYVCHELTHSITEFCKFTAENSYINSNETYDNGGKVINCFNFLNEVMAEATACDLANSYFPEKRTAWAFPDDIKSDWHTPFNQQYQQLGKEFIETFIFPDSNMTERELFKALTIQALNHVDIGRIILDTARSINPNGYKKDLYEATKILANIPGTHSITRDTINKFRRILDKYSSRRKMIITRDPNNASESRTFVFKHKPKHKMVIQRDSERNITLTHNPNRESHSPERNITLTHDPNRESHSSYRNITLTHDPDRESQNITLTSRRKR